MNSVVRLLRRRLLFFLLGLVLVLVLLHRGLLRLDARLPFFISQLLRLLVRRPIIDRELALLGRRRVLANRLVHRRVQVLQTVGLDALLDVLREELLVFGVVLVHELLHVLGDVGALDAVGHGLGVVLLGLLVVAREALVVVGDVEAAVGRSFQCSKDAVARRRRHAHIQQTLEGPLVVVELLNKISLLARLGAHDLAIRIVVALVQLI